MMSTRSVTSDQRQPPRRRGVSTKPQACQTFWRIRWAARPSPVVLAVAARRPPASVHNAHRVSLMFASLDAKRNGSTAQSAEKKSPSCPTVGRCCHAEATSTSLWRKYSKQAAMRAALCLMRRSRHVQTSDFEKYWLTQPFTGQPYPVPCPHPTSQLSSPCF